MVAVWGRHKKRKRTSEEKITSWLKSRRGGARERRIPVVKQRVINKENPTGTPVMKRMTGEPQTQVPTIETLGPAGPPTQITMKVGNERCPVASCKNQGGKGFRDLQSHLERQHRETLESCEGDQLKSITDAIKKLNRVLCCKCRRIRAKAEKT